MHSFESFGLRMGAPSNGPLKRIQRPNVLVSTQIPQKAKAQSAETEITVLQSGSGIGLA